MHLPLILAHAQHPTGITFHSASGLQARVFTLDSCRNPVCGIFQEDREMPDVHITWLEGRTVDQKRKVAQRITQVLMEEAGAKSESTHIVFVDVPTTNFASGGVTVADRKAKTQ
jgi:4-oxalocrotonate tautomerase